MNLKSLAELLDDCLSHHAALCPRQVLGVRMGMYAGEILQLDLPQKDKRLLTIVETDGCAADGIAVATNCWVGHRTLHVENYGKVAATFVDTCTQRAIRIAPHPQARERARRLLPHIDNRWQAMLLAYQQLPPGELFVVQKVALYDLPEFLIGEPGRRTNCQRCGEEIMNGHEVKSDDTILCRACSGKAYYRRPP